MRNLICLLKSILIILSTVFCSFAFAGNRELCLDKRPASIEQAISACKTLLDTTEPRFHTILHSEIGRHYFSAARYKDATPWLLLAVQSKGAYYGDFFKLGIIESREENCEPCLLKASDYFKKHIDAQIRNNEQPDAEGLANFFRLSAKVAIRRKDNKAISDLADRLETYSLQTEYLNTELHRILAALFALEPSISNRDRRWRALLERLNSSQIKCDKEAMPELDICQPLRDLNLMRLNNFGGNSIIKKEIMYEPPKGQKVGDDWQYANKFFSPVSGIRSPLVTHPSSQLKLISSNIYNLPRSADLFFDVSLVLIADRSLDQTHILARRKLVEEAAKRFNSCGIAMRQIAIFEYPVASSLMGHNLTAIATNMSDHIMNRRLGTEVEHWMRESFSSELTLQAGPYRLGVLVAAYEGNGVFTPHERHSWDSHVAIPRTVLDSKEQGVLTIAHEIGHFFDLAHPPTLVPNIMGYNDFQFAESIFDRFLPSQCDVLRASPKLIPVSYINSRDQQQLVKENNNNNRLQQAFAYVSSNIRYSGKYGVKAAPFDEKRVFIGECEIRWISKKFGITTAEAESVFIESLYRSNESRLNSFSASTEIRRRKFFSFGGAEPNEFCRTWFVGDPADLELGLSLQRNGSSDIITKFIESDELPWPDTSREVNLHIGDTIDSVALEKQGFKILRYAPPDSKYSDTDEKELNALLRQSLLIENSIFIVDKSGRTIVDACIRCIPVFAGNWDKVELENNMPIGLKTLSTTLDNPLNRTQPSPVLVEFNRKSTIRVPAPGSRLLDKFDVWRLLVREGKEGKPALVLNASSVSGNGYIPTTFDFSKFSLAGSFDDPIQTQLRAALSKLNVQKDRSIIISEDSNVGKAYYLAQRIIREGYTNVYQMSSSLSNWRDERLPMSRVRTISP